MILDVKNGMSVYAVSRDFKLVDVVIDDTGFKYPDPDVGVFGETLNRQDDAKRIIHVKLPNGNRRTVTLDQLYATESGARDGRKAKRRAARLAQEHAAALDIVVSTTIDVFDKLSKSQQIAVVEYLVRNEGCGPRFMNAIKTVTDSQNR